MRQHQLIFVFQSDPVIDGLLIEQLVQKCGVTLEELDELRGVRGIERMPVTSGEPASIGKVFSVHGA
jgi:hypothetical protein